MPRATVLPYKGSIITIQSILKLKHNWKVSAFALIVQMKNVGVFSEWQYKNLVIQASKIGLRTKEIDGIKRETSYVINKILTALSDDGCSIADLAKSLHLPIDEVSGLLFKCAVIPNTGSQPSNIKHFSKGRARLMLVK